MSNFTNILKKSIAAFLTASLVLAPAAPVLALGELPVTPPADTTPPVISGVSATSVSSVSESLVWTTNELAVSTFEYGTTQSYGSSANISASLAIGGAVTLVGLVPSTAYFYCIHATDGSNNSSQSCSSFTTAAAPVVILPPVISLNTVTSLATSSATITWTTNTNSDSQVNYGLTSSYGSSSSLNSTLGLSHSVTLSGLSPNTTYHYQVASRDASNNLTTSSDATFTTNALPVVVVDTTPPVVSLATVTSLATSSATITWTTSEQADGQIVYGTSASYGSTSGLNTTLGLTHSISLSNLSPNTTYHYQIKSRDAAGNLTNTPDATFTTNALPIVMVIDSTPPVISNISASTVSSVAEAILWTTNELATSTIRWSTNTSYSSTQLVAETAGLAHTGALLNLSPSTTYYYCIDAADLAGNASHSCGNTFTTAAAPAPVDTAAPEVSAVLAASVDSSSATITWTTNELADSYIEYGPTTGYGSNQNSDATLQAAHIETLSGLSASMTYHYRLRSTDASGNEGVSGDYTFTTSAAPTGGGNSIVVPSDTVPPDIISISSASISTTTATINWVTNEIADSQVEYGLTRDYGLSSTPDATLSTVHEAMLAGLAPGTTYHYRVVSSDHSGNTATSPDNTFTTNAMPQVVITGDHTPPTISDIFMSSVGSTNASLSWTTNELATSSVVYGRTTSYGSTASVGASAFLQHDGVLVGLAPITTYYYCIYATDLSGNTANSCGNLTTLAPPVVPDTTNPLLSLSAAFPVATSSATIHWTSDEPVNAQIKYGTTASYGLTTSQSSLLMEDSVTLTNLTASTTYHYQLVASDSAGNVTASSDQTFTTAAIFAPVISAAQAISIGTSSATVAWETDKTSDTQVEYGFTSSYGSTTERVAGATLLHSITLSPLQPYTQYHYRAKSRDAQGNLGVSGDYTFTTLIQQTVLNTAPTISGVSVSSVSTSSATVSWTTDEVADTQAEFGFSTGYGEVSAHNEADVTSHTVTLSGLLPGTSYHVRAVSRDGANNTTLSEDYTFQTLAPAQPDTTPPVAAHLTVFRTGQTSAILTWRAQTGVVAYDLRFGTSSIATSTWSAAHSAQDTTLYADTINEERGVYSYEIADLTPDTLYHFALKARDSAGNWSALSNVPSARTLTAQIFYISNATSTGAASDSGFITTSGGGSGTNGNGIVYSDLYSVGNYSYRRNDNTSPRSPTLIMAEGGRGQIMMQWKNPSDSDFARVTIIRNTTEYPDSLADGDIVYEGNGQTFTDTQLQNEKKYYYAVFASDASHHSSPILFSQTPSTIAANLKIHTTSSIVPRMHTVALDKTLQSGARGHDVEDVQELLATERSFFPEQKETGYFGPLTQAAVVAFQKQRGLAQTGVVDTTTRAELVAFAQTNAFYDVPNGFLISRNLSQGAAGHEVVYLQKFLAEQGLLSSEEATGEFDQKTRNAVIQFQQLKKITPPVGYVGSKTRAAIRAIDGR